MRKIALFLLAGVALAQDPAPPYQNIGTMSQLMVQIIYPTSDAMFYVKRAIPKTEAEWEALQGQALMLAESGNLLMMPGRARDNDGWMKDSKLLVEAGMAAYKAAKAKDVEGILALNDQIYQSCVACHQTYRPGAYGRRRTPAAETKE